MEERCLTFNVFLKKSENSTSCEPRPCFCVSFKNELQSEGNEVSTVQHFLGSDANTEYKEP